LNGVPLDEKTRVEIEELADTLKGNFDKVVHQPGPVETPVL
jgi:hypothetical protein